MDNNLKNKIKNVVESKTFHTVMYTIGVLAIAVVIFRAGMAAGFRKASFSRDWGNNYSMNFASPQHGPQMMGVKIGNFRDLPNAHGAIGKIINIKLPTIVVLDEKDQTEKIILIKDDTEIRNMRDSIKSEQLKIDDHIIIIGDPNSSGQIEAKFIRFIPFPPQMNIKNNDFN
ncbi:MAG TPA: hypothetical protein VK153_01475 [Candidatus Paceibacterota bacterium]|nr:hypothetical protein [Candidatus Paceibacterota bacterium]